MKIYVIVLAVIIFSGVAAIFNELNVFNAKAYEPGYNISQSEARGVLEIGSDVTVDTKTSWTDRIAGALGLTWLTKVLSIIGKMFEYALNLGDLFKVYVPGIVGETVGTFITGITYVLYIWGLVQFLMKVSSKTID